MFAFRASLLNVGFSGGRSISVDLQGPDIAGLMDAARFGMETIRKAMPEAKVRPVSGLSLAEPELQVFPKQRSITEAGLNLGDLADAVQAMTSGLFIGEYFDGDDR